MQRQQRHRRTHHQEAPTQSSENSNPTNNQTSTGPDGAVYGIIERPGLEKAFWSRIGVAFKNKDGSINLKLDFLPTDPASGMQVRWVENDTEN